MKKKLFDLKLFREGFRQTRVLALISLVPLLVSTLAPFFTFYFYWSSVYNTETLREIHLPLELSCQQMHPLLSSACLWLAPLLTLRQFSYLTSRKGSDFYHAVPANRNCVYWSFFLAVLAWQFLLIFGSTMVSGLLTSLVDPGFFRFSWPELLTYAASSFLCCLYVSGAAVCAASMTGTVFTNILATILIVFGPRLISGVLWMTTAGCSPVLLWDRGPFFSDPRFHLPSVALWNMVEAIPGIGSWYQDLPFYADSAAVTYGPAILYTAILGALFGSLGALLYRKRKSEAAGMAASSPLVRGFFRVFIAFLICLVPIVLIIVKLTIGNVPDKTFWPMVVLFYAGAVLVFFLYELIVQKKWSALKKALPSLAVLALLNVLTVGIMLLYLSGVSHYRPDAAEIESVRYLGNAGSTSFAVSTGNTYFTDMASGVALDSEEIKDMVSAGLISMLDEERAGGSEGTIESSHYLGVATRSSGTDHYRKIRLSQEDYQRFCDELKRNEKYLTHYAQLPSSDDPTLRLDSDMELSKTALRAIYQGLLEDVRTMDPSEWYDLVNGSENDLGSGHTFYFSVRKNTYQSMYGFPLSKKLPRMYEAYWAEVTRQNTLLQEEVLDRVDQFARSDYVNVLQASVIARFYENDDAPAAILSVTKKNRKRMVNGAEQTEDVLPELQELLRQSAGKALDPDGPKIEVKVSLPVSDTSWTFYSAFFAADPSVSPLLSRYFIPEDSHEGEMLPINEGH
ncbi:MAG: hypothetical protein IK150_00025 [Lachnospiraceae bacterium]|nr:hypothetical protein [Lachnospiraceae bacterium]